MYGNLSQEIFVNVNRVFYKLICNLFIIKYNTWAEHESLILYVPLLQYTAYPSAAPEFTPVFFSSIRFSHSIVFCSLFCLALFFSLSIVLPGLLRTELRLLITPLVFLNFFVRFPTYNLLNLTNLHTIRAMSILSGMGKKKYTVSKYQFDE